MTSIIEKPKLFLSDNSLVITYINPNSPKGGSSVVLSNLLGLFDPNSFKVVTTVDKNSENATFFTIECIKDVYKYNKYIRELFWKIWLYKDVKRIQDYIDKTQPEFILLIYPHLYNVLIFLNLKLPLKCKVVSYFHDTFVEGQLRRLPEVKLKNYHKKLMDKTDLLLVLNEGMKSLYDKKYKLSYSIEHVYPEYDKTTNAQLRDKFINKNNKSLFWGGNIVSYSKNSLKRVVNAGIKLNYRIELSSKQSKEIINNILGVSEYNKTFYTNREDYINSLKKHSFLLLALDWEFETDYHIDEINTIFSTKAIEYFLSGVPIILHAPSNYFMSQFLQLNKCGYVIDSINPNEIINKINEIGNLNHSEVIKNAIMVAKKFSKEKIIKKWEYHISSFM